MQYSKFKAPQAFSYYLSIHIITLSTDLTENLQTGKGVPLKVVGPGDIGWSPCLDSYLFSSLLHVSSRYSGYFCFCANTTKDSVYHRACNRHTTCQILSSQFVNFIVYRKGDIVMEPMNSRDVLPKNVPGVGWGGGGVGWVM